jgi:predicted signal transduction protein with EAL and GGDEF domain
MAKGARERFQIELRFVQADGSVAWTHSAISAVRDVIGTISFWVAMIEDITETKRLSEQLTYQASHDALTGLINRREFETRLRRVVDSVRERPGEHAPCYLDFRPSQDHK